MLALVPLALVWLQQPETPALPATTLLDAGGPLRGMALDATGGNVYTLREDGRIAAAKRAGGAELWRHEEPAAWTLGVAERAVLAVMRKPLAASYDPRSGERQAVLAGTEDGAVTASAFDPQGRCVWAATDAGLVRMAAEQKWSWIPLDFGGVSALALDEKGERLAIGNRDGSVHFAAAATGELDYKKVAQGPACAVTALAYGPKVLIVASEDRSLRLLNPSSAMARAELGQSGAPVRVLAVAGRAGWFASGDGAGNVLLWTLAGTVRAHWFNELAGTPVVALAFDADAQTLLVAAGPRVVALDLSGVK